MPLNPDQRQEALVELGKTFRLAADGITVQMFSTGIDSVWHDLTTDADRYEDFSLGAAGRIVTHKGGSEAGSGAVEFVRAYEDRHGNLPDIWFTDENGSLDTNLKEEYRNSGVVTTGWRCVPTHACME